MAETIEQSRPVEEQEDEPQAPTEKEVVEQSGVGQEIFRDCRGVWRCLVQCTPVCKILLEHPGSGTPAEIEDRAFRRIIRGWKDEEATWVSAYMAKLRSLTLADHGAATSC